MANTRSRIAWNTPNLEKRLQGSCTCSYTQNPAWGWMLCSSSCCWGSGTEDFPALRGPSLPPWQATALSEREALGSCHPAGKRTVSAGITRREEIRESDRKLRGSRGSTFSQLLSFLSSSSTPTRGVSPGCGQRCTILFPYSRDVTGRWNLMRLGEVPHCDWLAAPKDIWCNQILEVQHGLPL